MEKSFHKRFVRIFSVFLIVFLLFYMYLPPVNGKIVQMNNAVGENKVDIICVGSSHMYSGINPVQLYYDKGWVAYNLGVGAQSPWQSR